VREAKPQALCDREILWKVEVLNIQDSRCYPKVSHCRRCEVVGEYETANIDAPSDWGQADRLSHEPISKPTNAAEGQRPTVEPSSDPVDKADVELHFRRQGPRDRFASL